MKIIKNMRNNYYIYFHINPLKKEVFYVGKGCNKRAFSKNGRNDFWKNIVKKYGYIIDIIEENLTEQESLDREIFYIKKIGRKDLGLGPLVNMSDGGENGNNRIRSIKHKNNLSKSLKGRKYTDEYKKNMSEVQKNRLSSMSDEYKKDMTNHIDRKGVNHSEKSKEKMSNTRINFDKNKKLDIYNKFKNTIQIKYKQIFSEYEEMFLKNLDSYCGNIRLMCRELKIGRGKFYRLYKNDYEFKIEVDNIIKKYKIIC
jgi:hypothetical protein